MKYKQNIINADWEITSKAILDKVKNHGNVPPTNRLYRVTILFLNTFFTNRNKPDKNNKKKRKLVNLRLKTETPANLKIRAVE